MPDLASDHLVLGVDLGTSGARAIIIGPEDSAHSPVRSQGRAVSIQEQARNPTHWWQAVADAIEMALSNIDRTQIKRISVSATSGTVLSVNRQGEPTGSAFMYSDPCPDPHHIASIQAKAPAWTPARGKSGGLACALTLLQEPAVRVLHQADWLNYNLTGLWVGDSSSSLKSGYDPVLGDWPDWVDELGLTTDQRCQIVASGEIIGPIDAKTANRFGLSKNVIITAGTTDGCASFLATGAAIPGDAVSALGTTLTVKLLSNNPIFKPEAGVYNHLVAGNWLVGGASNAGGGVLLDHFQVEELTDLSRQIDGAQSSGLDYYPLSQPGERFPIADPDMQPRLTPRPESNAHFLHGMLDGLAQIEAQAYQTLADMGAPPAQQIFSTGGGTQNPAWMAARKRLLKAPLATPLSIEAAYGTALLAQRAMT